MLCNSKRLNPLGVRQTFRREGLGEFRTDFVSRGPFDHCIRAFAARQHQPHARSNFESPIGLRHEAAFGQIKNARIDAIGAEFAHLRFNFDRHAGKMPPVVQIFRAGYSRPDHSLKPQPSAAYRLACITNQADCIVEGAHKKLMVFFGH